MNPCPFVLDSIFNHQSENRQGIFGTAFKVVAFMDSIWLFSNNVMEAQTLKTLRTSVTWK